MRVHVIGFGNCFQGDDGVGPHVCQLLLSEGVPEDVAVYDAGTSGLRALSLFEDCDLAIVVDAVEGEPGSVLRLTPGDARLPERALSTHELGLAHLLKVLPISLDEVPDVVLFGVGIGQIQPFSERLSPAVARAATRTARWVRREIDAWSQHASC